MKSYPKHKRIKLKPSAWKKRVIECFERDEYICQHCDRACAYDNHPLSVHHIVNRSQGGGDELSNLVSLCTFPCHRGVTDKLIPNDFINEEQK